MHASVIVSLTTWIRPNTSYRPEEFKARDAPPHPPGAVPFLNLFYARELRNHNINDEHAHAQFSYGACSQYQHQVEVCRWTVPLLWRQPTNEGLISSKEGSNIPIICVCSYCVSEVEQQGREGRRTEVPLTRNGGHG